MPRQLLSDLEALVPELQPQPLHFRHGRFQFDALTGTWVPAEGLDDAFPLLLAGILQWRLAADFRTLEAELALMLAEPHVADQRDVPDIQARSLGTLQELLFRLCERGEYRPAEAVRLQPFQQATRNRLAGVKAALRVQMPAPAPCC